MTGGMGLLTSLKPWQGDQAGLRGATIVRRRALEEKLEHEENQVHKCNGNVGLLVLSTLVNGAFNL